MMLALRYLAGRKPGPRRLNWPNMPTTFYPLPTGLLQLRGSDRVAFLHGQTSNDVRGLATPGRGRNLLLNARGQIEFATLVYRRQDELLIVTEAEETAQVLARLKRYVVFDDVQLSDVSSEWQLWHIVGDSDSTTNGEQLATLLAGAGAVGSVRELALALSPSLTVPIIAAPIQHGATLGLDLLLPAAHGVALQAWLTAQGARQGQLAALEQARVLAGIPQVLADQFHGLLPQECGLERSVSYKKGCYIGQEIMARLEARGQTQKQLERVRLTEAVATGSPIFEGIRSKPVGQIGLCVPMAGGFMAVAVLRKDVAGVLQVGGIELEVVE
jgi:tRNA-modifying protein YgfZ